MLGDGPGATPEARAQGEAGLAAARARLEGPEEVLGRLVLTPAGR